MPFVGRALSLCSVGLAASVVLVACQSGTRGSASGDSTTKSPSVADTSASRPPAGARTDSVVVRTDKAQYRPGDRMTLTFENRSAATYAFNPCARTLEREDGSAWVAVTEEGRMCTREAWILDPHGTRSGPTELPASMPAARYRVVVRMTVEGGATPAPAVLVVSDPITIGA